MQITALNIYPVKSLGAISCAERSVERQGLRGDRRYMLVDHQGRFITQRQFPKMALVKCTPTDDGYRLTAPAAEPLELPAELTEGTQLQVTVWRDTPRAIVGPDAANNWFSSVLGLDCRLVFLADSDLRQVNPQRAQAGDQVSFADGAPLLLTSESSLADLNTRLPAPVSMARFRPNIVVNSEVPYAEDEWRTIRVGECEFEVGWPCSRCVLTTVDPESGERDPQRNPLSTLKGYRDAPDGPLFGVNILPRKLGRIRVGDTVRLS